jgi:predicted RNA-binding protein YlxR (DUF448 family)
MDSTSTRHIYLKIIEEMVQELKKNKLFKKKLRDSGIEYIKEVILTRIGEKSLKKR